MAALSDYLENELLDHVIGNAAYTAPSTVYIALHTADPTDAGTGTEVSGNNYSRASVTNNATQFPAASGGTKSNANAITFAAPSGSWGTVTHVGVWDAASAGNLLWHGALTTSKAITSGDTAEIAAGDLDFTLA